MVKPVKTLLLLVLTAAAAVSFRNDFVYFLLGFELMVLAAAWLQCLYISRHIGVSAVVPRSIADRGKPFAIQARLDNRGVFPIQQLNVRLSVQWYPEKEMMLVNGRMMLAARESGSLCFELEPAHCGCIDVRADRLEVTDSLGLMRRRIRPERQDSRPLYILPDTSAIAASAPEAESDFVSDGGASSRAGRSEPDVTEIRTYREGDSVRLIHWKLYARVGELLVRDMSEPVERFTWLYLDLGEQEGAPVRSDPDAWDHFIETVAGISAALLQWGRPHLVVWVDSAASEFVQRRVNDGESMQDMLCSLLRAQTYPAREKSQLLREIRQDETKGTCIEINLQGHFARTEAERQ